MRTANFTELRANLKDFLDQVTTNSEPLFIMRQPELMESLVAAERDVEYGNTFAQDKNESLEDFLNRMACTE